MGNTKQLGQFRGDHDDGSAAVHFGSHEAVNFALGCDVDPPRWFVENKYVAFGAAKCSAEDHLLLVATR